MPLCGFEFCTYLQTPFGFGFELSNPPSARTGLLRRLANVLHYEAQAVCPITNMEVLCAGFMPGVLWWEDVWILFMCTQQITLEMRLLWVCCLLGLFVRVSVFNLMRGIRSPTSFFRKDGGYNDTKYHPILAQSQIISVLIPSSLEKERPWALVSRVLWALSFLEGSLKSPVAPSKCNQGDALYQSLTTRLAQRAKSSNCT